MVVDANQLHTLADDWDRYREHVVGDPEWRKEMQRAVVAEMEVEVARLKAACQPASTVKRRGIIRWRDLRSHQH